MRGCFLLPSKPVDLLHTRCVDPDPIMRRCFSCLPPTLAILLLLVAVARAQQTAPGKVAERGWGDSWTSAVTDEQRKNQEFVSRCQALAKTGNYQSVLETCNSAIQQQPEFFTAYFVRGSAYAKLKKYDLAIADYDRAKDLAARKNRPLVESAVLNLRGETNKRRNDYRAAANDLRAAVNLDQTNSEALNNLAWLLATAPDATFRNGREAVRLAKKALATATNAQSPGVEDTLAAAYAEANEFPRAVETEKHALAQAHQKIKDVARLETLDREANKRLLLYEQRQPFRALESP